MDCHYSFEKLEVWQKSRKLVKQIYSYTKDFSAKDKARFYEVAYGSLLEVMNQLIISNDLKYLKKEDLCNLRHKIDEIGRMLDALYKSSNS